MFSNPLSPFEKPKTNNSVFQREPDVLPCELNYILLERQKNFFRSRRESKFENKTNLKNKQKVQIKLSKVQTCATDLSSSQIVV